MPARVNDLVAFFSNDKAKDRDQDLSEQSEEPFDSMSPKFYRTNPEVKSLFLHDPIDISPKKELQGFLDEVSGIYDVSESEYQVTEDVKEEDAVDVVAPAEGVPSVNSSLASVPVSALSPVLSARSVSENAASANASLVSVTAQESASCIVKSVVSAATKAASATPSLASVVKSAAFAATFAASVDTSLASAAKSGVSVGPMVSDRACNTEDDLAQPTESEASEYDEGVIEQKNLQSMAGKLAGCIAAVKKQETRVQNESKEYKKYEKLYIKSKQKLKIEETKLKNLKEKGKRQATKLTSVVSGIKALD